MNDTTRKQHINKGDILVSTWGYEQTNADFFEALTDAKPGEFVKLQPLKHHEEPTGDMTGRAVPVFGSNNGKPIRRKVSASSYFGAGVRVASYASAFPWDGRPISVSHYA